VSLGAGFAVAAVLELYVASSKPKGRERRRNESEERGRVSRE
jgi:hypothetical protein